MVRVDPESMRAGPFHCPILTVRTGQVLETLNGWKWEAESGFGGGRVAKLISSSFFDGVC